MADRGQRQGWTGGAAGSARAADGGSVGRRTAGNGAVRLEVPRGASGWRTVAPRDDRPQVGQAVGLVVPQGDR